MKKIYYLQKRPVKIGDVIEHNGFRATVTEELIELNPELFVVEDSMQELLDKAKRRYPPGTRYISFNEHKISNKEDLPLVVSEIGIPHINHYEFDNTTICIDSGKYNGVVYANGKWAEILPLKFTTEDGVDIYDGMKTYKISKIVPKLDEFSFYLWTVPSVYYMYFYHKENALAYIEKCKVRFVTEDGVKIYDGLKTCFVRENLEFEEFGDWKGNNPKHKYFYHKENALAYIERHKEKTLEDYENLLVNYGGVIVYRNGATHDSVWDWFKTYEPKLYYSKILQLIADDLNDGWVANFSDYKEKWFVSEDGSNWTLRHNYGVVPFKTKDLAEKARNILGDKVKYLFN